MDRSRLRSVLGGHDLEPHLNSVTDNLAIALCMYFEQSQDRPEDDPETDDNHWGVWVEEQCNRVLDQLTDAVLALSPTVRPNDAI